MTRETPTNEIISLLSDYSGRQHIPVDVNDIFGTLGIEGDDANEFLDDFADVFDVDMSDFIWYFHYNADEPPGRRRVLPILANGEAVPYQPIAFRHLVLAAEKGRWEWSYPDHSIRNLGFRHAVQFIAWALVGAAAFAAVFLILPS